MSERALMNVMGRVSKVFPHIVTRKKKRSDIATPSHRDDGCGQIEADLNPIGDTTIVQHTLKE
jgi:hypothetical protein